MLQAMVKDWPRVCVAVCLWWCDIFGRTFTLRTTVCDAYSSQNLNEMLSAMATNPQVKHGQGLGHVMWTTTILPLVQAQALSSKLLKYCPLVKGLNNKTKWTSGQLYRPLIIERQ